MPIPQPEPDESVRDFVSRCMVDDTMRQEWPDIVQRYAVCLAQMQDENAPE